MFGAGEFSNSFRCGVQFAIRAVLFALAVFVAPVSVASESGESEFRQHRIAEIVPRAHLVVHDSAGATKGSIRQMVGSMRPAMWGRQLSGAIGTHRIRTDIWASP